MCFSATASFSVAAILLPAAGYTVSMAWRTDPKWIPIAVYPIIFSIQQAIEGMLWIGITSGDQPLIDMASRGFLFFSQFFWLAWVPISIRAVEEEQLRRRLLFGLSGAAVLFGLSMILPLFFFPDWLSVELAKHSLRYKMVLIYDGFVSRPVVLGVYACFIVSALFLSSDQRIRTFGKLITLSLLITYFFFAYAFISVWCFFAAVVSVYIIAILMLEHRRQSAVAQWRAN